MIAQEKTTKPEAEIAHATRHRRRKRRSFIPRRVRRFLKALPWQLILIVLVLALVVPSAAVAVLAADSYARVREMLASLERVLTTLSARSFTELSENDFERLQASVNNLSAALRRAQQQTSLLRVAASAIGNVEILLKGLDAAQSMSSAAQNMLEGVRPAIILLARSREPEALLAQERLDERLTQLLRAAQGRFETAKTQLASAQANIREIGLAKLPQNLLSDYRQLVRYHALLERVNGILLGLPALIAEAFALDAPKNYLLLSQNNDELRPSGGYISTYGWLRVRQFRIVDYDYSGTSRLSPNPPPDELAATLEVPAWWFKSPTPIMAAWSGSWYADFPSTARMAIWYYEEGENPRTPIDAVIALDLTGFQMLLEALGQVQLADGRTIDAATFRQVIYAVRANNQLAHKDFLAQIYRQMMSEWQNLSTERSMALLTAAIRAFEQKHLILYFTNPEVQATAELLGWTGAQADGTADYLMVVDSNMGNKSNSSVVRSITYSATIQADRSLKSRAVLDYDYSAQRAADDPAVAPEHYGNQRDYFSLTQLYVPVGSQLVRAANLQSPITVDEQRRHTIFATGFVVPFDEQLRLEFEYTVPNAVQEYGLYQRYQLLIQKQLGTRAERANVQITLPVGSRVISVTPNPSDVFLLDAPILEFRLSLLTDQQIEIIFAAAAQQ
jgi:hypothetical protein